MNHKWALQGSSWHLDHTKLMRPRRGSQRSASSPNAHRKTANCGTAPTCETGVCANHSKKAKEGPKVHPLREILEERWRVESSTIRAMASCLNRAWNWRATWGVKVACPRMRSSCWISSSASCCCQNFQHAYTCRVMSHPSSAKKMGALHGLAADSNQKVKLHA